MSTPYFGERRPLLPSPRAARRTATRRRLLRIGGLVGFGLLVLGACRGDSLWKAGSKSLVSDKRALKVGDLVTLLIVETSSATQRADTQVSNKAKIAVGPGIGPVLRAIPGLGFNGSTDTTAQGSTSRAATLAARMTVRVVEVKPNGNMVLEGERNVLANHETQILKVRGMIRPDDVGPDNSVQSTYLADAKIEYTGKGALGERQKPGILSRIFRQLF